MLKFLIILIVLVAALCLALYYIPTDARTKTLSTIGLAPEEEPDALKQATGDITLPQDPPKRREALLAALKKKINEIQNESGTTAPSAQPEQASAHAIKTEQNKTIQTLAQSSQAIIAALEQSNTDSGLGTRVMQRVLNTVLPEKISATATGQSCDRALPQRQ